MTIGKRTAATVLGLGLVMASGSFRLFAQDPASGKAAEKTTAKKKADPSRRVPTHFGQIGLTTEQREAIYKVRKSHQDQIDSLRKQIAAVEAKSLVECEAVLTDTQRKLLENFRSDASRGAASKATEPAKSSK